MGNGTATTTTSKIDAIVEKAAAATPTPQLSGVGLYSRFALAGAVCCSVTHGALTPVDVYVFTPCVSAGHAMSEPRTGCHERSSKKLKG